MKAGAFLFAKCIVSLVFGILYVILAPQMLTFAGMNTDATGKVMVQFMGALLIGVGIICWYTRGSVNTVLGRAVLLALFVADTIGFVVMLMAQLAGLANSFGWVLVAIWLVFALGLGYYRFLAGAPAAGGVAAGRA